MTERAVEFASRGTTLRARWHEPSGVGRLPVVLMVTGDGPDGTASQTWADLIPMFVARGLSVLSFDFAGLGRSDGRRRELTLSRGCQDLDAAIDELVSNPRADLSRVGAFGSSFGGNVLLLAAHRHAVISAIALKSPCSFLPEAFLCEFGPTVVDEWAARGYLEEIGFDYASFLDALAVSTYAAAAQIHAPVRVVHGSADGVVPMRQSRDLMHFLVSGTLRIIEGADHRYTLRPHWDAMAQDLVSFLCGHLAA